MRIVGGLYNTFDAFNNLVEKLFSFLKSKCFNLVRPQLEIRKLLFLYRFVHRFSLKHMSNRFDVGAFIIQKYVNIVHNVSYNKDKLFWQVYMHIF